MTQIADYFKPDVLLSPDNPFLESAAAMHRVVFETFDRTARAQLSFIEDLLDINRIRFELLYAGRSFTDTLDAQQQLIAELGQCAARYASELGEIAVSMGSGPKKIGFDAANVISS